MERVFNFSAGPSVLPEPVLAKAAEQMMNFGSSGMSVMEMSHRSVAFKDIIDETKENCKKLLNIPDNYKVLFLQGGASLQFAMIPMNLMVKNKKVDFIDTGAWTTKAMKEAKLFGEVNVVASSKDKTFSYIPDFKNAQFSKDADYLHIVSNNTIYGTEYTDIPQVDIPIVADMSSNIMSKPINVADYGVIFAGAQKNIGPAGVTLVIIREDLVGNAPENVPTMLNYTTHVKANSMFNTPPTYGIYMAGLVFKHLLDLGGLKAMEQINKQKAELLYDYLDNSKLYSATVEKQFRSNMNVPFVTGDADVDAKFVSEAAKAGLVNLKGHRSVGGMRASIYNAMPLDGVKKLVEFMKQFEKENVK